MIDVHAIPVISLRHLLFGVDELRSGVLTSVAQVVVLLSFGLESVVDDF